MLGPTAPKRWRVECGRAASATRHPEEGGRGIRPKRLRYRSGTWATQDELTEDQLHELFIDARSPEARAARRAAAAAASALAATRERMEREEAAAPPSVASRPATRRAAACDGVASDSDSEGRRGGGGARSAAAKAARPPKVPPKVRAKGPSRSRGTELWRFLSTFGDDFARCRCCDAGRDAKGAEPKLLVAGKREWAGGPTLPLLELAADAFIFREVLHSTLRILSESHSCLGAQMPFNDRAIAGLSSIFHGIDGFLRGLQNGDADAALEAASRVERVDVSRYWQAPRPRPTLADHVPRVSPGFVFCSPVLDDDDAGHFAFECELYNEPSGDEPAPPSVVEPAPPAVDAAAPPSGGGAAPPAGDAAAPPPVDELAVDAAAPPAVDEPAVDDPAPRAVDDAAAPESTRSDLDDVVRAIEGTGQLAEADAPPAPAPAPAAPDEIRDMLPLCASRVISDPASPLVGQLEVYATAPIFVGDSMAYSGVVVDAAHAARALDVAPNEQVAWWSYLWKFSQSSGTMLLPFTDTPSIGCLINDWRGPSAALAAGEPPPDDAPRPNVRFDERMLGQGWSAHVVATRDIAPGETILVDYGGEQYWSFHPYLDEIGGHLEEARRLLFCEDAVGGGLDGWLRRVARLLTAHGTEALNLTAAACLYRDDAASRAAYSLSYRDAFYALDAAFKPEPIWWRLADRHCGPAPGRSLRDDGLRLAQGGECFVDDRYRAILVGEHDVDDRRDCGRLFAAAERRGDVWTAHPDDLARVAASYDRKGKTVALRDKFTGALKAAVALRLSTRYIAVVAVAEDHDGASRAASSRRTYLAPALRAVEALCLQTRTLACTVPLVAEQSASFYSAPSSDQGDASARFFGALQSLGFEPVRRARERLALADAFAKRIHASTSAVTVAYCKYRREDYLGPAAARAALLATERDERDELQQATDDKACSEVEVSTSDDDDELNERLALVPVRNKRREQQLQQQQQKRRRTDGRRARDRGDDDRDDRGAPAPRDDAQSKAPRRTRKRVSVPRVPNGDTGAHMAAAAVTFEYELSDGTYGFSQQSSTVFSTLLRGGCRDLPFLGVCFEFYDVGRQVRWCGRVVDAYRDRRFDGPAAAAAAAPPPRGHWFPGDAVEAYWRGSDQPFAATVLAVEHGALGLEFSDGAVEAVALADLAPRREVDADRLPDGAVVEFPGSGAAPGDDDAPLDVGTVVGYDPAARTYAVRSHGASGAAAAAGDDDAARALAAIPAAVPAAAIQPTYLVRYNGGRDGQEILTTRQVADTLRRARMRWDVAHHAMPSSGRPFSSWYSDSEGARRSSLDGHCGSSRGGDDAASEARRRGAWEPVVGRVAWRRTGDDDAFTLVAVVAVGVRVGLKHDASRHDGTDSSYDVRAADGAGDGGDGADAAPIERAVPRWFLRAVLARSASESRPSNLLVVDRLCNGKALVRAVAKPNVPPTWLPFHTLKLYDSDNVEHHVPGSYVPNNAAKLHAHHARRQPRARRPSPEPIIRESAEPPGRDAPADDGEDLRPGDRVLAAWDADNPDDLYGATVTRVHDSGTVDLEFDDGAWWRRAPPSAVRRPTS